MKPAAASVVQALREPATLSTLSPVGWSSLLAKARRLNLIGALAERCLGAELQPPAAARRHLNGVLQVAERQRLSVAWEVAQLGVALQETGAPVLLLKGAAYVMGVHGLGRGRMFGDIDILVPRSALGTVEKALMLAGWVSAKTDEYDQRYYRQWMHELPPMTHIRRGTVLDVHHTILPLTARHAPDPASIIALGEPLADTPGVRVPCPEDLLVHSLTHLMHEGELHNGLRDLHDADEMARVFGADPQFWERLTRRAAGNDLAAPVGLGLALARRTFGAPVPDRVIAALLPGGVPGWLWPVYRRALAPSDGPVDALASLAVYARAHALRMPPPMLVRHLAIKAWRGLKPEVRPAPRPEP